MSVSVLAPIPGHRNYFADMGGSIWSSKQSSFRKISEEPSKGGYLRVRLFNSGKYTRILVHRAVLMAFRGLPSPKETGSHINGVRTDNRIHNLSWESQADNLARRDGHGTMVYGQKNGRAKLTPSQVIEIRSRFSSGEQIRSISKDYPVTESHIGLLCKGRHWNEAIAMKGGA